MSMVIKLARMVIYLDRLLIIKSYKALMMWSCKVTWQTKNHHISITRMSMATKLGRMIASLDTLLPIISHDPLIVWPCEIRGSLTGGGSGCKRLSSHQLLVSYQINYRKLQNCLHSLHFCVSQNITFLNILPRCNKKLKILL